MAGFAAGAAGFAAGRFASFFLSSAFARTLLLTSPASMRAKEPYFMALERHCMFIVSSFFLLSTSPSASNPGGSCIHIKSHSLLSIDPAKMQIGKRDLPSRPISGRATAAAVNRINELRIDLADAESPE